MSFVLNFVHILENIFKDLEIELINLTNKIQKSTISSTAEILSNIFLLFICF